VKMAAKATATLRFAAAILHTTSARPCFSCFVCCACASCTPATTFGFTNTAWARALSNHVHTAHMAESTISSSYCNGCMPLRHACALDSAAVGPVTKPVVRPLLWSYSNQGSCSAHRQCKCGRQRLLDYYYWYCWLRLVFCLLRLREWNYGQRRNHLETRKVHIVSLAGHRKALD
jgi:hypothetical protein